MNENSVVDTLKRLAATVKTAVEEGLDAGALKPEQELCHRSVRSNVDRAPTVCESHIAALLA